MKKHERTNILVVNASALAQGGALTILKQFLYFLGQAEIESYVFIPETVNLSASSSLHLIPINTRSALRRIAWDWFGLKHWLKKNQLTRCTVFSLQNTSMRLPKNCRQFIYLHQALILHEKKWSFLKKEERSLAFYQHIYPLFVFSFAKPDTYFVVQTQWMKTALQHKFKWDENQILVFRPQVIPVQTNAVEKLDLSPAKHLFYPANGALFKNHVQLIHAMDLIKKHHPDINVVLHLTLSAEENPRLTSLVNQLNLKEHVQFLGPISFEHVLRYYQSCTTVVFPSFIESFGLPLLEAAQFGKPVVVANEAYAHEVISDYKGAIFVDENTASAWKAAILQSFKLNVKAYCPMPSAGWPNLIEALCKASTHLTSQID